MKKLAMAALCVASCVSAANAGPVTVNFTTTGSSGDWTYDFTFANNVTAPQGLYFLGIDDTDGSVVGIPAGFNEYSGWNTAYSGGTAHQFGPGWLDYSDVGIASGSALSGFLVHDTAADVKTSFTFFGYTYAGGQLYNGPYDTGSANNPGFIGVTGTPAVPEPASWALMLGGFGMIGGAMRSRRRAAVTFA
jgi:hypothetical protein